MTDQVETTTDSHHDVDHDDHSHGGTSLYLMVFGALCVLTALSFLVGNSSLMTNNVKIGWALMMAISCGKALLVIMFLLEQHLAMEHLIIHIQSADLHILQIYRLMLHRL